MTEAMERTPMQGAAFELPLSAEAKAAGVTGAFAEPQRPGLPGETVRGAVLKGLFRASHSVQAPRGSLAEQMRNRSGLGYVTDQELGLFEARSQQGRQEAGLGTDTGSAQLLEADKQQTEKALDTTRSALNSAAAAQAEPAKPQPQDRNEGAKQPTEATTQEPESETELLYLVSKTDGSRIPITVPKNYTRQDLTHAIQALGGNFADYEAGYTWTPQGVHAYFKNIWRTLKKAFAA